MALPKRKQILNAALKALIQGAQTSPLVKIPAAFISELAALPDDKQESLPNSHKTSSTSYSPKANWLQTMPQPQPRVRNG
jgi:hypothetical protein